MTNTPEKVETVEATQPAVRKGEVAVFARPRIPYHPLVQERFGVDAAGWRALIDAIWPAAKTADAVVLALSYCKARNLDPFKRPIHIVQIWSKELGRMTESVWPGIGELRTTAFRTGLYAGRDKPEYGQEIHDKLGGVDMKYPEWCEITVYRLGRNGERMPYPGPRVYWTETYATAKRDSDAPNDMWRRRPYGQIEKCAEAAALRAAFPEELGNEYTAEEMEGQIIDPHGNVERAATPVLDKKQSNLERFEEQHGPVTDVPESYEVIDMTGAVAEYPTPEATMDAYNAALLEGEQQKGEAGLTTVWDNNQGFMRSLDERGYAAASETLSREYGPRRQIAAARENAEKEAKLHSGVDKGTVAWPGGTHAAEAGGDAGASPPAADKPRDLLGGTPAEDLRVPLPRNPSLGDLEFFTRQMVAMIEEKPGDTQRLAQIKRENEDGIAKLKTGATASYNEVQAALTAARKG